MKKLGYYWSELRKKPLAYHLVLIAATLLALGVTAHLLMQVGTRHGARRRVPDFAGMPLREAQQAAQAHDLKLFINDSLYVPAYEGGIVLDQLPENGVEVKPGRTVYITVNASAQKMVPVPYVAGRSLRQAKNMLDIAGLSIDRLVYLPDLATNYVLSQQYNGKQVGPESRIEAEMGSGVTLYVGVAGGHGTTVTPRLAGLSLREAKSRLWEQGLNIGRITFDEGINPLNQKDARVYIQEPGQERSVVYGTDINLRLTLDTDKADKVRAQAEKAAKKLIEERLLREREIADSLAALRLEEALMPKAVEPDTEVSGAERNDEFFF